jgi:CO/xanthine dehydrogenase FAD-binding subunit
MAVVDYNAPQSVQEAVALLSGSDIKTKVMAGGTDLIIQSKSQTIEPLRVVDLKHIAEMMSYSLDGAGLSLGPCMCCAEFTALQDVKALYPHRLNPGSRPRQYWW